MKVQLLRGIQGRAVTVYGLMMLVPLILALYQGEKTVLAFAVSFLTTMALGLPLFATGKIEGKIGVREGFATVAGIWIFAVTLGALPYFISGHIPNYLDALFEATAGFTATGATILPDVEKLPRSLLLWRSLTHWLGGMGIIVFFMILLPKVGMGAVHLFRAEMPGSSNERVSPKIRQTAILLWGIYVGFTLLCILLLKLAGMPLFDAVNHAFSAISTGGFSVKNTSIGAYNSLSVEIILMIFMLLSGISFTLYINAWRKGSVSIFNNTELKVFLGFAFFATAVVTISLVFQTGLTWTMALRQSAFHIISVMTTTGFSTSNYDLWPSHLRMLTFFLMFIGGCATSTSGGLKVVRVVLLFKTAMLQVKQAIHPHLVSNVILDDHAVDPGILRNVSRYFALFMMLFTVSSLLLAAAGMEPFEAMGAAVAALGNAGAGFGTVGPTSTYQEVAPFGKMVLIVSMLLGRLELMTFLVMLRPEFWQSKKNW